MASRHEQSKGGEAESRAAHFLGTQGLRLLERNFRCKLGEIDLIMLDRQCLVFVEVRLRNNRCFGSGAETVTAPKQQRIIRAAQFFLARHPHYQNHDCRFDVVAWSQDEYPNWIRNAFQPAG